MRCLQCTINRPLRRYWGLVHRGCSGIRSEAFSKDFSVRCGEEAAENALQRAGRGAYNKLYRPPLPAPCVHLFCEKINSTLNCPVFGQFQKWLQPSGDRSRTFESNVFSLVLRSSSHTSTEFDRKTGVFLLSLLRFATCL